MNNRELDKWIAENVMGWKLKKQVALTPRDDWYWVDSKEEFKISNYDWHPTESISDAFQVVEKMVEKGYYTEIDIDGPNTIFCCFVAGNLNVKKDGIKKTMEEKVHSAINSSASLAICFAAKKAIESETTQELGSETHTQ